MLARSAPRWLVEVVLFFVWWSTVGSRAAEPPDVAVDELRLAVETLRRENIRLQEDVHQREAVVRVLTENLAITRTESELFQKRWADLQARVQTLGVAPSGTETDALRRQLVESMRALYLAEAERERLGAQLTRLLEAVRAGTNVTAEAEQVQRLLEVGSRPGNEPAGRPPAANLDTATVVDVNFELRVVVLNVGSGQEARVGMPFLIWRGERVIAEVRVVEVRRSVCAAVIERMESGMSPAAGDAARVTKS